MTSTIDHDRSQGEDNSPSALHELAARVGIVPEYFDIQGRVHRASDDSRRAILSALGFDVSSSAAERDALDNILREEQNEIVSPVRVARQSSGTASMLDVHVPAVATSGGS
jgi:hypothetical protein